MGSARKKTQRPVVQPIKGKRTATVLAAPVKEHLPLVGNQYRTEWKDAIPKWPYYPFQELASQQARIADELCQRDPKEFHDYDWAWEIAGTRVWVVPSPAAVQLVQQRLGKVPWNPYVATGPVAWQPVALVLKNQYGLMNDKVMEEMSIVQVLHRLSSPPPPKPPPVRLFFDPDKKLAWLDREEIKVPNFGQIAVLKAAIIKGGDGGIFFWSDLKTTESSRPEQNKDRLPPKLRVLFVPADSKKKKKKNTSGTRLAVRARIGSPENSQ